MQTYLQEKKCKARHVAFKSAISKLTIGRTNCCCVDNLYVRNLYDYFMSESDGNIKNEVKRIDTEYIKEWEKFQKTNIGFKNVEDLSVCYLGGPEPENDFNELIGLGILPHNIWAFENDEKTYHTALMQLCNNGFPRPKLIQMNIEKYFKDIPKKFDIFYYDACATVVSKNALRVIGTMCKYHRLNSPGIIITNFSEPDFSHKNEVYRAKSIIEPYFLCKIVNNKLQINNDLMEFTSPIQVEIDNIDEWYSKFTTEITLDIASGIIPVQRFINSDYAKEVLKIVKTEKRIKNINEFNQIQNSIHRFAYLKELYQENNCLSEIYKNVFTSMSGYEGYNIGIAESFRIREQMKKENIISYKALMDAISFFNKEGNVFQFLDKSDSELYIDLLINQMGYPLHFVTDKIERYKYRAKTNTMMLDIIPFDECRYIYEWLPATDQVISAFMDKSWQYVFRFAVDGLVKNRLKVNNDIFYKGSVISKNTTGFEEKRLEERMII